LLLLIAAFSVGYSRLQAPTYFVPSLAHHESQLTTPHFVRYVAIWVLGEGNLTEYAAKPIIAPMRMPGEYTLPDR
jgi:hypothetical protein